MSKSLLLSKKNVSPKIEKCRTYKNTNRFSTPILNRAPCGNMVIFLQLRFYVKSNFGDLGVSKSAILTILSPLNLGFEEILQFLKLKFAKNKKFRVY